MGNASLSSPLKLSLSAIVPAHRAGPALRQCIACLAGTNPPPDEIILVADGAVEEIGGLAEEFGIGLVRNPIPGGPARARNMGAVRARGDLLLFVDSDVAVAPDAIARVRLAFSQDPRLAAVFGSYDDQPAAPNFLSQYKNLFHHYTHQTSSEEASTFWGALGAVRRPVFMDLGGFDENYRRPCIEDIELGRRLKKAGCKIRLVKDLQGKHLKIWKAVSLLKSDFFDRALPWTDLILRNRSLINDLNLRSSHRISTALAYAMAGMLLAASRYPAALISAGIIFAVLLSLNASLYRFFWSKRGFWFVARAVPWHCIYYLCCGLAFAVGFVRFLLRNFSAKAGKSGKAPGEAGL